MFFIYLFVYFLQSSLRELDKHPVPIKGEVKNNPDSLIPARDVTFSDVIAAATQTWETAVMIWIRAPAPSHLFTTCPASMCRYEDTTPVHAFPRGLRVIFLELGRIL